MRFRSLSSGVSSPALILSEKATTILTEGMPKEHDIQINMDGRGAWRDNVFVERLWRSLKYEEVYLHAYDTVSDARGEIGKYFDLYNRRRPHSNLKGRKPDHVYCSQGSLTLAA